MLKSYLVFVALVSSCYTQKSYGEVGEMEVISIKKCDVDPNAADFMETELEFNADKKVYNSKINLKTAFDDTFKYTAAMSADNGIKLTFKGTLCTDVGRYIPAMWEQISSMVGVNEECPIQPGEYEIKDYSISAKDIGLPFAVYGHVTLNITILKDDKLVQCTEFVINSTAP